MFKISSQLPDYHGVIDFALEKLRTELDPLLTYHCVEHTENEVLPAARQLAKLARLGVHDTWLLQVAAAFHDIGYTQHREDHEKKGVKLAQSVLPKFGFSKSDIQTVCGMIMATKMPQSPTNNLEMLMADADLDGLGKGDFFERSHDLRQELENEGSHFSAQEWLKIQIKFLASHRYFTKEAVKLREAGKKENLARLQHVLSRDEN